MSSLFDDLAVFNDDHVVGISNGGEAMGDDKTGSALHQAQKRFLNAGLGSCIYAGGGLIQNEDARVCQDGAGDGEQLTLPLAEVAGALGKFGLVTFRQLEDEVIGIGKIPDIFAHRGISENVKATGNAALFDATLAALRSATDRTLVFANFVDFDMLYGHRRDVEGYATALEYFDGRLPEHDPDGAALNQYAAERLRAAIAALPD